MNHKNISKIYQRTIERTHGKYKKKRKKKGNYNESGIKSTTFDFYLN